MITVVLSILMILIIGSEATAVIMNTFTFVLMFLTPVTLFIMMIRNTFTLVLTFSIVVIICRMILVRMSITWHRTLGSLLVVLTRITRRSSKP